MNKPIRFDDEAEEELTAAAVWYERRRAGLARSLLAAVDNAVHRIRTSRESCSHEPGLPHELGVRRAFVEKFPYRVVFVELADEVRVLAVAHHSQRPGYWSHRLAGI